MEAITKNWLAEEKIKEMVKAALGEQQEIRQIKKLSGGFCSAVYLVETQEQKMVLKVATDEQVKVMRHEREYVPTEAQMLQLFGEKLDILMPEILYYDDSKKICDVPYIFMSFIEGKPLCENKDLSDEQREAVKVEVGHLTKEICSLKADRFGIPNMPESYCTKNSQFVYLLFDWLLLDAEEKNIEIPGITPDELRAFIKKYASDLDEVKEPCYAHTDTWDGNIMVNDGKFTGLVDYAAILYGDPLISHDFHDFGESPYASFLKGYGKKEFTDNERLRMQIYRIWQRLGMVVERGYREYEDPGMYAWVLDEFRKEVEILKREW